MLKCSDEASGGLEEAQEAKGLIDYVLDKNSDNVEAHILQGRILEKLHKDPKNADAIKEFEHAINLDKSSSEAFFHLG